MKGRIPVIRRHIVVARGRQLAVACAVAVAGLLLTACGAGQMFGPTVTPTLTFTPTATLRPLPTNTATSSSTPEATSTPRATPTPACLTWDQVDKSLEGKTVCVKGTVAAARDVNAGGYYMQFRVFFSDKPNTFFFADPYSRYPKLKPGDCVASVGVVKLDSYGVPFLDIGGAGLYKCPS